MSRSRKRRCTVLEDDPETQSDIQQLIDARVPVDVEEDSSSSSTCSSSFPSSTCSSSLTSSSCSSSFTPSTSFSHSSIGSSSPEDFAVAGSQVLPQSTQGACSSFSTLASAPLIPPSEGSFSQSREDPSTSQVLPSAEVLSSYEKDEKVTNLVNFLLFKYQMNEVVSEAEILNIIKSYNCYSVIISEASECMQLIFGIDLKEVDPLGHTYILVTSLGISYDGMSSKVQGMPKTGLLILILSIIFLQDNCAPEEDIWQTLNVMGICAGVEHFIYGEPRRLILEDFVQEQYLVYRQVPNSEPARYEFVWGPRAHAETSKMKILKFLASISGADPRFFGQRYEEALRDEDERALGTYMATALAHASPSDH